MTRRLAWTLAVAVVAACCGLPLASAATAPLGSPSAPTPPVPTLGFAAMLPDTARAVTGHFLADGSRLTLAATDATGTAWRVTLEPGALPYPVDVHVVPLVRAVVWGGALRPAGGIVIDPPAELAVPAEVSARTPGGTATAPPLLADADGGNLRLAPRDPGAPGTAEVSRLGAVLSAAVPRARAYTYRAAVRDAAASRLALPIAEAVPPPEVPARCIGAAEASVRATLTDAVVAADVDPERDLVEQLAAAADAAGSSRSEDARAARALAGRVAQRLTTAVDAARARPGGGAPGFDALATAAESILAAAQLFPQPAAADARPPARPSPRPSPTPGMERTVTDPAATLAAELAGWGTDLTLADAAALAGDHDYDAPARAAARARLLEALGIDASGATSRMESAERFHIALDVSVASRPGAVRAVSAHAHIEADLRAAQGGPGTAAGASGGVAVLLGALRPCASPPTALIGAASFGAGRADAATIDAAVRSAFAGELEATGGLLPFRLLDGASPAVDAAITGTGALPSGESADVSVHAVLVHTPGQ